MLLLLFWFWRWWDSTGVEFVSRLNSPIIVGWDVDEEVFLRRCEVLQIRERISGRERLARGAKA